MKFFIVNIEKIVLILFISCLLFISCSSLEKLNFNSKEKAQKTYYKAKISYNKNKLNKSLRLAKKAYKLDRNNPRYYNFFKTLNNSGSKKKNVNLNELPRESMTPIKRIVQNNFIGYDLLSDQKFIKAYKYFYKSFYEAIKYFPDDNQLLSICYNNLGCAILLRQSKNFCPHKDKHNHLLVLKRDIYRSYCYFEKAVELEPKSEVFEINRSICKNNYSHFSDSCNIPEPIDYVYPNPGSIKKSTKKSIGSSCSSIVPGNFNFITNALNQYDEVIFLLDISGSMMEMSTYINETKINILKESLKCIVAGLNNDIKLGYILIGKNCNIGKDEMQKIGTLTKESFIDTVERLQPSGSTPLNMAIERSPRLFSSIENNKTVLLCTDGNNTCGNENSCNVAERIFRKYQINFFILSFLQDKRSNFDDHSIFYCIAETTGGYFFKIPKESHNIIQPKEINLELYPILLTEESLEPYDCIPPKYAKDFFKIDLPYVPKFITSEKYTISKKLENKNNLLLQNRY